MLLTILGALNRREAYGTPCQKDFTDGDQKSEEKGVEPASPLTKSLGELEKLIE